MYSSVVVANLKGVICKTLARFARCWHSDSLCPPPKHFFLKPFLKRLIANIGGRLKLVKERTAGTVFYPLRRYVYSTEILNDFNGCSSKSELTINWMFFRGSENDYFGFLYVYLM